MDILVINDTKYSKMMYRACDASFVACLSNNKIYEEDDIEHILDNIIKNSKIIVDIGAHCGSHSIIYSKLNPNALIYSFEPQLKMFNVLNLNIKNNDITNIKTFNCALGNKVCKAQMDNICRDGPNEYIDINNNNNMHFNLGGLQIGLNGEDISIEKLDNFDFGKIDFIKIDVKGFEDFVIDGGLNTIMKYRPIIFYEKNNKSITPNMDNHYNKIDYNITQKLFKLNYSITMVNNDNLNNDNYLAIPN
jgi:FkbM family methyltransferase